MKIAKSVQKKKTKKKKKPLARYEANETPSQKYEATYFDSIEIEEDYKKEEEANKLKEEKET